MQERRNSSANALELRLSCTNPSTWSFFCCGYRNLWLKIKLIDPQPPQLNPLITASSTAVIGSINIHICLSSLPYTVNSCYYAPIYLCCLLHLEWGNSYAHTIITVYLRLFWSLEIYRNTYSAPAGSHRTASFTWIHLDHRPYSRQVTEWMECDVVIHPPPTVFPKVGSGALRDQWAIKYHCQNYSPTIVCHIRKYPTRVQVMEITFNLCFTNLHFFCSSDTHSTAINFRQIAEWPQTMVPPRIWDG